MLDLQPICSFLLAEQLCPPCMLLGFGTMIFGLQMGGNQCIVAHQTFPKIGFVLNCSLWVLLSNMFQHVIYLFAAVLFWNGSEE